MIEKRIQTNKEFLVQTTESAIQSQVLNYISNRNKKDEDEDDKQHF